MNRELNENTECVCMANFYEKNDICEIRVFTNNI